METKEFGFARFILNSNIQAFTNGYTYGETEDYEITILPVCPAIGSNVCKWIGVNSKWNDVANWCPSIPTINDIASIPLLSGVLKYPTIDSGTVAVCRSLKIEDGASVNIDCPYSTGLANDPKGSLRVADSLIIGVGSITTSSSFKIKGETTTNTTIPSASAIPPNGNGVLLASIFQNHANHKLQISYSASELYSTFGWRIGDVIDSIKIIFNPHRHFLYLCKFSNC